MDKKNFKILVADDDDFVRDVITTVLSQEGFAVTTVREGIEAIERLRVEEYHLVITDLVMPGANGIDVLKYAARSNSDMAVVILTGCGTLDATLEAIKEGAYEYLTKPCKPQEIAVLAERAWQRARLTAVNRNREKTAGRKKRSRLRTNGPKKHGTRADPR